jgi:hypothetical protein
MPMRSVSRAHARAVHSLPFSLARVSMGALVVSVVLALGCAKSEPSAPACDAICLVSNGATAAASTTYWRVPGLSCGQNTCYTKIAFYADHTGHLTTGTNNCALGSTADIVTFTWSTTGPGVMLVTNGKFSCSPNPATTSGTTITSFTGIAGGISTGAFTANLNGQAGLQGTLIAGAL